jgi:hypothetical protein
MAPPIATQNPTQQIAQLTGKITQLESKNTILEGRLARMEKSLQAALEALEAHAKNTQNPHTTSASQLSLENVPNLGLSPIELNAPGLARAGDVYQFAMDQLLPRDHLFPNSAVVIGQEAGHYGGTLGDSVLIGARAGRGGVAEFTDYVTIGADTHPLASYTVSIGHSTDQFVMPKDVITRADKRDFSVAGDLDVGLDFVLKLKPVMAHMDLREDYIDYASMPLPPEAISLPPASPLCDDKNPANFRIWAEYRAALKHWQENIDAPYQVAMTKWRTKYLDWQKSNRISYLKTNGKHKHEIAQAMLIADDILNTADILKTTPVGVVNFKDQGGLDVKGVRNAELVPVLVKAIHDLHAYVHTGGFVDRLVASMLRKGQSGRDALRLAQRAHENAKKEEAQEKLVAEQAEQAKPAEPVEPPPEAT